MTQYRAAEVTYEFITRVTTQVLVPEEEFAAWQASDPPDPRSLAEFLESGRTGLAQYVTLPPNTASSADVSSARWIE